MKENVRKGHKKDVIEGGFGKGSTAGRIEVHVVVLGKKRRVQRKRRGEGERTKITAWGRETRGKKGMGLRAKQEGNSCREWRGLPGRDDRVRKVRTSASRASSAGTGEALLQDGVTHDALSVPSQ